ncbi:hypothetical protein HWV62_17370 [Athelia sp. TMB]|nr:hypothetical protein HWV62_17370 [Athelia sp. TMB]
MPRIRHGIFCPRCGTGPFNKESSLLKHMNQPYSQCSSLIYTPLAQPKAAASNVPAPLPPLPSYSDDDMASNYAEHPINSDPISGPTAMQEEPTLASRFDHFLQAGQTFGKAESFMDQFDADDNAEERKENLYFPWISKGDHGLGAWLLRSGLSMQAIDDFLALELVKTLPISFKSAKDLRACAEELPPGPKWTCQPWPVKYPTKHPVSLFYRDSISCVRSLFSNPLFADHMYYTPFREFKTAEKLLPAGSTLIGTILSSDKTNISVMTGDHVAHPVLISLANISATLRTKSSHHAFILLALLPVPKFLEKKKKARGIMGDCLIHECLDFVLQPLKLAARVGIMMTDPLGQKRFCFTPLAAYMVDTQEAVMLATVAGKTSHVTLADYTKFGDPFRHPPRTASITLAQRRAIRRALGNDEDLLAYGQEAMRYRLNGVEFAFWRDWAGAEPAKCLTPEPLHHWHKAFWDHDAKWCIRAVGPDEIDFRLTLIPCRVGFRYFKEGISKLKQVTGREHRDVERYIVSVIADAVPKHFAITIRAMMDFRYLAQAPKIDDNDCAHITSSLNEFHQHKQAILDAGARVGKGNHPINNWYIPKLEMLQSVVENIRDNGAAIQFLADITEHGHITYVKDPAQNGNNQNYESQIVRALDRLDKLRRFDLATSIRAAGIHFGANQMQPEDLEAEGGSGSNDEWEDTEDSNKPSNINTTKALLERIHPTSSLSGPKRRAVNYFLTANRLAILAAVVPSPKNLPFPLRTFTSGSTSFHLARDPSFSLSVDDACSLFKLPDLRQALSDYWRDAADPVINVLTTIIGTRCTSLPGCSLPFDSIRIWPSIRMQSKTFHYPERVAEPRTVMAAPPSEEWPFGQCDTVLVNNELSQQWPASGFNGHSAAQLRLILHVHGTDTFLAYIHRFDVVAQSICVDNTTRSLPKPNPVTGMYVLKRAVRADGHRVGAIIPVSRLRGPVQIVPRFGEKADTRLTMESSMEYSTEFWLNKIF